MNPRRQLLAVPILPNVLGCAVPDWAALDSLERAGAVKLWPRARAKAYRADPEHAVPSHEDYQLLVTVIRRDDHARNTTTFYTPAESETQPVARLRGQPQPFLSHA